MINDRTQIEQTIAALEAQRATLGDSVVETALAPLRARLAALAAAYSSEHRRRQATVLFADIVGARQDQASNVLDALWQRIHAIILAHGGFVDKRVGDIVMVVWGADATHEEDAECAIRASLAMQEEIAQYSILSDTETYQPLIRLRVGISTGPVLFGAVGTSGEFTAMGDTVNLAARLVQIAPAGGVMIEHETYRHVVGVFDVAPRSPIFIKGRQNRVQTYLVEKVKTRIFRRARRGIEGMETQTVGREAELLELQRTYESVFANSVSRLITIVGDPGVGKSRLLHEFDHWIELLPEYLWFFVGRSNPLMTQQPYGLLRNMLGERFEIQSSDSPADVMTKLRAGLAVALEPDEADLVGRLVGFDVYPTASALPLRNQPTLAAAARAHLTSYLRKMLQEQPAVIFFEDIHWADTQSLELISHWVDDLADLPLLIVATAYDSLSKHHPSWGTNGYRQTLRPLSTGESYALVDEIMRRANPVPTSLSETIVAAAEGNPLRIEEQIKLLLDTGTIERTSERWIVRRDRLLAEKIPPTLYILFQARINRLSPDERVVLQRAAVVGRIFWNTAIDAIGSEEPLTTATTTCLELLRRREIIFERNHSSFVGMHEYVFKHAVLREVVYSMIPRHRRMAYHAEAAAWLEQVGKERIREYVASLAIHYTRAGDALRAATALRNLAQQSVDANAYTEAIEALQQALELLTNKDAAATQTLQVAVQLQLGEIHELQGHYVLARTTLEQALEHARTHNDCQSIVSALGRLGRLTIWLGDYTTSRNYLDEALPLTRKLNDMPGEIFILRQLGNLTYGTGDLDEAQWYLTESLRLARQHTDPELIASTLNALGNVADGQGDYPGAVALYDESLSIARTTGNRYLVSVCLGNLSNTYLGIGRGADAERTAEEALMYARSVSASATTAWALEALARARLYLRQYDAAYTAMREAIQLHLADDELPGILSVLELYARLCANTGRTDTSLAMIGMVLSHSATQHDTRRQAEESLMSLRSTRPDNDIGAALARGAARNIDSMVDEVLRGRT